MTPSINGTVRSLAFDVEAAVRNVRALNDEANHLRMHAREDAAMRSVNAADLAEAESDLADAVRALVCAYGGGASYVVATFDAGDAYDHKATAADVVAMSKEVDSYTKLEPALEHGEHEARTNGTDVIVYASVILRVFQP